MPESRLNHGMEIIRLFHGGLPVGTARPRLVTRPGQKTRKPRQRARTTGQPPRRPTGTGQRWPVVLRARQPLPDPERQCIGRNPVARPPADLGRLGQRKPLAPTFGPAAQSFVQRAEACRQLRKFRCQIALRRPPFSQSRRRDSGTSEGRLLFVPG